MLGAVEFLDPAARARGVRKVLLVTLVLNWLVCAAKGAIAVLTQSLSVRADAFHSFLDGSSNIAALVAMAYASRGPDRDHPYGHRKFEIMGAMVIGILLAITAYTIIQEAIERLETHVVPNPTTLAFAVMAATVVVNILVTTYERRRGIALGSELLVADSAHTRADVGASLAVIGSLVCAQYGLWAADIIISLLIAMLVAWAACRVTLGSVRVLSDRVVLDPKQVAEEARKVEGVLDCHEVRTRGTEDAIFADLRIHVSKTTPLGEAHAVAHRVEERLRKRFPGLRDVVIHPEPHEPRHP